MWYSKSIVEVFVALYIPVFLQYLGVLEPLWYLSLIYVIVASWLNIKSYHFIYRIRNGRLLATVTNIAFLLIPVMIVSPFLIF